MEFPKNPYSIWTRRQDHNNLTKYQMLVIQIPIRCLGALGSTTTS